MASRVQSATSELPAFVGLSSNDQKLGIHFARRRAVFWTIVALLGLLQAWSHRFVIDHDGVAYLDVAQNYARGAWSSAINGYYSPLYSWLLAIVLRLSQAPRSWESTLLHLVNFAGYLGAYACFEFFLRQVIRKEEENLRWEHVAAGLSENAWHTLGLGLFVYSSLNMAGNPGSTPDIFVVLLVYLTAGLLIRMQSGDTRAWIYGLFGAALALGYLAKAAMFPLSFVFMAIAGFLSFRQRKGRLAFLLTPICFVLVAGPWITVLSRATGRYTFGDAGRLNYRWNVAARANPSEWGGQTEPDENLLHPPRRLWLNPPVFEFATPVAGTFPLWYGSSYWLEGSKFHFSWAGQMRTLHQSYNRYWEMLDYQKEYLVLLLTLAIAGGTVLGYFRVLGRWWALWLPATAAISMYALVWVEPRYVAAFVVMLWISLFAASRPPRKDMVEKFAHCAVVATVLTTGVGLLHGAITDFHHSILQRAPNENGEVAEGLHKLGVLEGQSIATIGIPNDRESFYWARLAGVRVIAEVPTPNVNQYWFASPDTQETVRSLFAEAGAVAIVTNAMPTTAGFREFSVPVVFPGWRPIGDTSYFLLWLQTRPTLSGGEGGNRVFRDK